MQIILIQDPEMMCDNRIWKNMDYQGTCLWNVKQHDGCVKCSFSFQLWPTRHVLYEEK
jgi:hypothetical protein